MSIEGRSPGTAVSRRSLIKTAAGAGIAVAVVGTVGIANAGTTTNRHEVSGSPLTTNSGTTSAHTGGPVVVHVTHAGTGMLEIYTDGARTNVHDPDLASRVTKAAKSSPAVIHVMDGGTGSLEVYGYGTHTQIRDVDLARRIIRAA